MKRPLKSLRRLVGEIVIIRSSVVDPNDMSHVKLHQVDQEGVWIESQAFTDAMMQRCNLATSESTLIQFIPFARIDFIVASIDGTSLSTRAFGLSQDDANGGIHREDGTEKH